MASELKSKWGVEASIQPGKTGQFDVLVDSNVIYSKASTGRFPKADEVSEAIRRLKSH